MPTKRPPPEADCSLSKVRGCLDKTADGPPSTVKRPIPFPPHARGSKQHRLVQKRLVLGVPWVAPAQMPTGAVRHGSAVFESDPSPSDHSEALGVCECVFLRSRMA